MGGLQREELFECDGAEELQISEFPKFFLTLMIVAQNALLLHISNALQQSQKLVASVLVARPVKWLVILVGGVEGRLQINCIWMRLIRDPILLG